MPYAHQMVVAANRTFTLSCGAAAENKYGKIIKEQNEIFTDGENHSSPWPHFALFIIIIIFSLDSFHSCT